MIDSIIGRTKQGLSVLLSLGLMLSASAPASWANPAVNAAAVRALPAGAGPAGMAGAAASKGLIHLSDVKVPLTSSLGTVAGPNNVNILLQTPAGEAPVLRGVETPAVVPGVEAQFVERHPALGIINAVQKAGGHELVGKLGTAGDAQELKAVAEILPEGKAKQNLLAFAAVMNAHGGSIGASLNSAYSGASAVQNDALMPAVEMPKATGFWAWMAGRKGNWFGLKAVARKKALAGRGAPGLIDSNKLLVPVEKLRFVPSPAAIPNSSKEVESKARAIVGQDRALESLDFGLKMDGPDYNVIISGPDGTGRTTAVRTKLAEIAPKMKTPSDIVAVTNFAKPSHPIILDMEPGKAVEFRQAAMQTLKSLPMMLMQVINSGEFAEARKKLMGAFQAQAADRQKAFDREVAKVKLSGGFGILIEAQEASEKGNISIYAGITKDGKAVEPEDLDAALEGTGVTRDQLMSEAQAAATPFLEKYGQILKKNMEEKFKIDQQLAKLEGQVAAQVVSQLVQPLAAAALGAPSHQDEPHKQLKERVSARMKAFEAEVAKVKIAGTLGLAFTERGLAVTFEGKPISPKIFAQLQEKGAIDAGITWAEVVAEAQKAAEPLMANMEEMNALTEAEHKKIHENDPPPTARQQRALAWVKSFANQLASHYEEFMPDRLQEAAANGRQIENPLEKYKVQVLVDNAATAGAPVIFETNPTYKNLFGESGGDKQILMMPNGGMVQREAPGGPKLKSGSFLRANGGFLVIELMDLLREPGAYQGLMRMIRTGKAEISEGGYAGLVMDRGETIGIDSKVKVVLIASPMLKMLLKHHDEDFSALFRAAAEFESSMKIAAESIQGYLTFIKNMIVRSMGSLLEMNRGAMAAVVEYGAEAAGSNEKLSAQFGSLYALLRESTFWAAEAGRDEVTRADVDKALSERKEREGSMVRHMKEIFIENTFRIETKGKEVGQINGLAVMGSFGVPARITVRTSAGGPGGFFISADKNAGTTGPSFNKSIEEVQGFFEGLFAQEKQISARFRVAFEQNYGGIDGDSATQTMIYAMLSSLSKTPIQQGISITGSADQFGNVQAIGGVNHKIEGYFDVAKAKGFDGTQGVIIPQANVSELMLRPDIVEAVKNGEFHIWAVSHISQGVEILTGTPYAEVLEKSAQRLAAFRGGAKAQE